MSLPPPSIIPSLPAMQAFALALNDVSPSLANTASEAIVWSDTGPLNVPIMVRGDGVTIFDFPKSDTFRGSSVPELTHYYNKPIDPEFLKAEAERRIIGYARFQYMNAWLASYMVAMGVVVNHTIMTPQPLDPFLYLKAVKEKGIWHAYDNKGTFITCKKNHNPIALAVFEYALLVMTSAHKKLGDNFSTTLSLFQQACFQYSIHQFSTAHITAWSLVEQALNILWREYQQDASTGSNAVTVISKKRKDILNGNGFTASIITQILSLSGKIDDERLTKLDRARRSRNSFAHSLVPISMEEATNGITVAAEMISDLLDIKFYSNLCCHAWL